MKKQCQAKRAPGFLQKKTCEECPWRKDVPVGRFPPERFVRLRTTVQQDRLFNNPLFACHKSKEGDENACVGYLLRDGNINIAVRFAASQRRFRFEELEATGPLYDDFYEMARANGAVFEDEDEDSD